MKSAALLLPLVYIAVAASFESEQVLLDHSLQTYPGFDLDLKELRWVQLEGEAPVLMTELEKVLTRILLDAASILLLAYSDRAEGTRTQVLRHVFVSPFLTS